MEVANRVKLYSNKIIRVTSPPGFRYFIAIRHCIRDNHRYQPIYVELEQKGKRWAATIPYEFWCNRQSLRIHCTEDGVPKPDSVATRIGRIAALFKLIE